MKTIPRCSLVLATLIAWPGCGSDSPPADQAPDGSTGGTGKADAPTATTATTDGSSDTGGVPLDDPRGDPSTFPTQCLDCQEACLALQECGGFDADRTFLEGYDACVLHCEVGAGDGDGAPDAAETFRCCSSQDACDDVAWCGGWLGYPGLDGACEGICDCFFSGAEIGTPPRGGLFPVADRTVVKSQRGYEIRGSDEPRGSHDAPLPTFQTAWGDVVAATHRVIIRLPTGLPESVITSQGAGQVLRTRPVNFAHGLHVAEASSPHEALALAERLSAIPGVEAEPDLVRFYARRHVPDDPEFGRQWHLRNEGYSATGQPSAATTPGIDARLSEAWDLSLGSAEVIIAINDDGVDLDHPDFEGKLLPELHYPANWRDLEGFGGHGTAVAGVAAATGDNGEGGSGACPRCSILPSLLTNDVDGDDPDGLLGIPDSDLAQVHVNLVEAGAWIISNSWGPADGPAALVNTPEPQPLPMVIAEAFDYAETEGRGGLGTVILFAAGNGNEPVSADPLPSAPTTLAVGAIDDGGLKSSYSDFGPEVSIAAPSDGGFHGIFTTAPVAQGSYADDFGGTSSATPLVAGVAGLVLSVAPDLTAAQVRALLEASATPIDPANGAWVDGHSPYYGHGMVNAYRAVRMAMSGCEGVECDAPSDVCQTDCDGTSCAPCRNDEFCADGFTCQAISELGQTMCVPLAVGGTCPAGHVRTGDLCLPTRTECGACESSDACNGRDDDCSGLADDGERCDFCYSHDACASGEACLDGVCTPGCETDADCGGQACMPVATRYGEADGDLRSCPPPDFVGLCAADCSVRNSSAPLSSIEGFAGCAESAEACEELLACGL